MKRHAREIFVSALVLAATAAGTGAVLAGCGGRAEPKVVPDVTGQRLNIAEASLEAAGLDHRVAGGGTFGVVLRSRWQVCSQRPRPGAKATDVTLVVERVCPSVPAARFAVVPDVEYHSLDAAEAELLDAGLGWEIESDGVIVVRSHWTVCDQDPAPGEWADTVELYVERDCDDWDP